MSSTEMISPELALAGRSEAIQLDGVHAVFGASYLPPFAPELAVAHFGLGCFWGAERLFWQLEGVVSTAVGYAGGYTPNPSYDEVCTGKTGHAEVVRVVFDPKAISYETLLEKFFEQHDPTQGMRQGGDIGTQYRSMILCSDEAQSAAAEKAKQAYQQELAKANHAQAITTEIEAMGKFYYAELYHQQYLHKNPQGYCGLGGLGVCMPPSLNP